MAGERESRRARSGVLRVAAALAAALACGCAEISADAARAARQPAETAADLRPRPEQATRDRGRVFYDGCLVDQSVLVTRRCVYGKRGSRTTVVLFGDSEAMQFFPPLVRIARSRGWRLVTRLRAGCTPADIRFSYRCDRWRAKTLRLIERRDRPDLVVVTGGVAYAAVRGGRRLSGRASAPWLRRGYARTLRQLRRSGARVAVIMDTPRSPRAIPACVLEYPRELDRCAFARRQPTNRRFDARAARDVPGTTLIDPTPVVCPEGRCPAVMGDVLVYRDRVHFTAAFTATLTAWLRERLPEPAR